MKNRVLAVVLSLVLVLSLSMTAFANDVLVEETVLPEASEEIVLAEEPAVEEPTETPVEVPVEETNNDILLAEKTYSPIIFSDNYSFNAPATRNNGGYIYRLEFDEEVDASGRGHDGWAHTATAGAGTKYIRWANDVNLPAEGVYMIEWKFKPYTNGSGDFLMGVTNQAGTGGRIATTASFISCRSYGIFKPNNMATGSWAYQAGNVYIAKMWVDYTQPGTELKIYGQLLKEENGEASIVSQGTFVGNSNYAGAVIDKSTATIQNFFTYNYNGNLDMFVDYIRIIDVDQVEGNAGTMAFVLDDGTSTELTTNVRTDTSISYTLLDPDYASDAEAYKNVKLYDAENNEIKVTLSSTANNAGVAYIDKGLEYGKTYSFSIPTKPHYNGLGKEYGKTVSFTTEAEPFAASSAVPTISGENVTATATITDNTGLNSAYKAMLVVYDAQGNIIKVNTQEATLTAGLNTITATATVAGAADAHLYVWGGPNGMSDLIIAQ